MKSLQQYITEAISVMGRKTRHTNIMLSKLKKGDKIYLIPDSKNLNPDSFKELVISNVKKVQDKYTHEYWDGPKDIPVEVLFVYVEKNDEGIEYFWQTGNSVTKAFQGDEFALLGHDGINSFKYCKKGEKPEYGMFAEYNSAVVTFDKEELEELTKAKLKDIEELENKQKKYLDNVGKKIKAFGEPVETIKVNSYKLGQYLKRNSKNDFPMYYDYIHDAMRLYYNDDASMYSSVKDMINHIFGYPGDEEQLDVCIYKDGSISFLFGEVPTIVDASEINDIKAVKRLAVKK